MVCRNKVPGSFSAGNPNGSQSRTRHRLLYILELTLTSVIENSLSFQVTRIFRPTVLEVFGMSNIKTGLARAVYDVIALPAHFLDESLAERNFERFLTTAQHHGAEVATPHWW